MTLPTTVQEHIERKLSERVEAHERLRAELQLGVEQLDAGHGEVPDIESFLEEAHAEYAGWYAFRLVVTRRI